MKPEALARVVARHAEERPHGLAFVEGDRRLTWRDYHQRSEQLARVLVERGFRRGDRLAVLLPDGPGVHIAYLACEKAGLIVMGIGPRSGVDEIKHLVNKSGARALLARDQHRDLDLAGLVDLLREEGVGLEQSFLVSEDLGVDEPLLEAAESLPQVPSERPLAVDEVFLLNSTSGTTGLPKCVVHDQMRWNHFHRYAVEAGELSPDDVFMSALPAPFGFGLWTSHFTPTLLGAPTVVMERFGADEMMRLIDEHRVTVLSAVSTQFIMMLDSPDLEKRDLASLRVIFTGGEAVPYHRAAEFEERTGAMVLQFYGSNETGALSRTTTRDTREVRLRTAGHVIEEMEVRLYDSEAQDVSIRGQGQPACKGDLLSRGYWNDEEANRQLYTTDGWMLTGDVARVAEDGVLRVVGRIADFIIRGGKNISGPAVEEAVATHPSVALAAAVAAPDPVYGERVCAYVELRENADGLTLHSLSRHLEARGITREWFPERLVVVDEIPRTTNGKVAKGALRADIRRRLLEDERVADS